MVGQRRLHTGGSEDQRRKRMHIEFLGKSRVVESPLCLAVMYESMKKRPGSIWEAVDGRVRLKRHEKQSRNYVRRTLPEDFKALDGKIERWQDWLAEKYKKPEGYVNKNGVKCHYQKFIEKTGGGLVFVKNEDTQEIFRCSLLYMREHEAELREKMPNCKGLIMSVDDYLRAMRKDEVLKFGKIVFNIPRL
jgi:hypothetical protein